MVAGGDGAALAVNPQSRVAAHRDPEQRVSVRAGAWQAGTLDAQAPPSAGQALSRDARARRRCPGRSGVDAPVVRQPSRGSAYGRSISIVSIESRSSSGGGHTSSSSGPARRGRGFSGPRTAARSTNGGRATAGSPCPSAMSTTSQASAAVAAGGQSKSSGSASVVYPVLVSSCLSSRRVEGIERDPSIDPLDGHARAWRPQ